MNKKQIEKALQDESKLMYANVFDNVLNKLNIDPSTFEAPKKAPWWKSLKFVSFCSAGLATALIITISVVLSSKAPNNESDTNSYINLTIQSNNSSEKPEFAYSMGKKYSLNYFIAKNDDAKIIASGLTNTQTNGLALCDDIINEASKTGFINYESINNIINITVDSSTIEYSKSVANAMYERIKSYCKENYIYANVNIVDTAIETSETIDNTNYEKINQLFQLAEIFNYKDDETIKNPYYLSDSLEDWVKEFKDVSESELDNSINKLQMINDALKSDKAKKQFNKELNRAYYCYINGLDYLDDCLSNIKVEVNDSIAKLKQEYNYDYSNQVTYNSKPDSKTFIEKWRDFLSNIDDTKDFENKYDDYHYDYNTSDRPFDKDFDYDYDYDWEFDHNNHNPREPFRSKNKPFKENDDKFEWDDKNNKPKNQEFYINKINELVTWYNKVITKYSSFEDVYLNNVNRVIANVYYHAKDSTNKDYYIDYSKEYEDRNNKHGNRDDESWEKWKNNYDYNWWDK